MLCMRAVTAAAGVLAVSGCTTTPALVEATGGIPVYDIVLRTKCELSNAFEDDQGGWIVDTPKFAWLQNWTAQTDLTLQVLDSATLSPGASFMQPLHNAYPTAVGPSSVSTAGVPGTTIAGVSQSFAIAGGVNLNGQAQRTETLSFALSVKELQEWRHDAATSQLCAISDNADLRGRLGLREWFRDAVWPVISSRELLYAGYHPKPGGGSTTPQSPTPNPKPQQASSNMAEESTVCKDEDLDGFLDDLGNVQDTLNGAVDIAKEASKSLDNAASSYKTAKSTLSKAITTLVANKRRFDPVLDPAVKKQEDEGVNNINIAIKFSNATDANLSKAKSQLQDFESTPDSTVLAKAKAAIKKAKGAIELQRKRLAEAKKLEAESKGLTGDKKSAIDAEIKQLSTCILQSLDLLIANARVLADQAKKLADAATKNVASANENLKRMQNFVDAVSSFTSQSIDPPIASIGQSVQFTLAYGGNITPTWTFVRFKGPNNPLVAASGTRIHTLNITLGPVNPITNAPSADVKQNQFYLQLNNLLAPLSPGGL